MTQKRETDERPRCADCGEAWPLYGDEGLCYLCLPRCGNSGDPSL